MQSNKLPLGHWIRQLDTLLSHGIDEIHCSIGINRIDWQILHCINKSGQIDPKDLEILMKSFIDPNTLKELLNKFLCDGLISEDSRMLTLTENGIEMHKQCYTKQEEFRKKSMADISEKEYYQAIATLEKIANNLAKIKNI